jgi:DNA polymerase-3 subunit delta
MQLKSDQLAAHLAKGLRPLYTVWGDEPLLAQEAGDAIRNAARAAGYGERQVHTVSGQHFDWSGLLGAAMAMSLFSDRQLIEIRIPSGKPGKDGSEALQRYCDHLGDDVVTLVQLPKLDRTQQNSAWFGALDGAGVTVRVDSIARAALPQWIAQRLRASASPAAKRGSARLRSSPTASRATCSPRTRRSRSSACSTRPASSGSSRSNRRC